MSLWKIFRHPVDPEQRRYLEAAWARVPEKYQVNRQMYGRNGAGCGATIGTMPRCDFNCKGCYLGSEANRIPALTLEEAKAQIRQLREILGDLGNLQLTDGEMTLLPEEHLIELVRYAREVGLVPMLMTHGDSYRKRPGLLNRLVLEGGLTETSIHIDVTQKGRMGAAYKFAKREEELNPLRDEFADMIRRVRKETGRPLEFAMSVTITGENIDGIPAIMRWFIRNNDAFKLVSFQPVAQVGRTLDGTPPVTVERLWEQVAIGLYGSAAAAKRTDDGRMWYGHPDCTRLMPGVCVEQPGQEPSYHPIVEFGNALDERVVLAFIDRFRSLTFRADTRLQAFARLLGIFKNPWFIGLAIRYAIPFAWHWARRANPAHPFRFMANFLLGRVKLHKSTVISHHFMNNEEVNSPAGKERLDMCVFRVAVNGAATPMCEVNATTVRNEFYERIKGMVESASAPSA